MKYIFSFLLFILFCYSAQAQIINFPDPNFKNALVNTKCVDTEGDGSGDADADLNNDREIDMNEAWQVEYLLVGDRDIADMKGIENFKNLKKLICNTNKIKTLNVQGLTSLIVLKCAFNDLISINVQGLTNLVELDLNRNRLSSLDVQGLTSLVKLMCWDNRLIVLNVDGLSNLKELVCSTNNIISLNVEGLINLENLSCFENKLTSLDLHMLTKLVDLECSNNQLITLNVQGLTNLKILKCNNNQLTTLNAQSLTNLNELECCNNQLTMLNMQGCQNVKKLWCLNNKLGSINFEGLANLETLYCNNNQLISLNLQGLFNLKYLQCNDNQLTEINLQGLTKIISLICYTNQLKTLNIEGLTNLVYLYCSDNQLSTLNVQDLKKLIILYCQNNLLTSFYIKNGKKIESLNYSDNHDLTYICCNEDEISEIQILTENYGFINCEINSYCTFTPGGTFYFLNGENQYDDDKNGCDDVDKKLPHLKYTISNGSVEGTILSNTTGTYSIPVQEGTHTINPLLENSEFFEVSPPSLTVTFPGTSDTITQNFCITPKEPYRQVNITIIPLTPPARPGFDAKYKIIWENKGNLFENGTIHFTYNENIFDYVSANQTPDVINNGKLSWDYTELLPFEKREIIVTLNLNSPMENPPVNAGDITYLYANILDNVFRLENVIVGSYDPNDKTCLQGQYFHPDSVGKYVDFLIRFENTGNFAAENVVIKDIIDDKTFDVSSLLITDASHEVYTRIAANKVEFIFENIQLPFEDETNDGYVAFKIKTKSTLKLGDEMKNLADIYFDYNFPIRTNETQTTIAIPTGTKDIQTDVTIHPNPVRDLLMLDSSNRWTKAEIFDISGRLTKVTAVDGYSVDVTGLESGTYILHLSDKDKRGRVKFVKL